MLNIGTFRSIVTVAHVTRVKHHSWAQLSQFSAVTLQIKPDSNSLSPKGKLSFPPSDQSHMLPMFPDFLVYAPMWSLPVRTLCVNRSYVLWFWSSVWGLSCPRDHWGGNAFLQATPEVCLPADWTLWPQLSHRTLLWSCVKQADILESIADPGVQTSSNLTTETSCLSFKSLWRYWCKCSCFHFTPLEWTHAESE